MIIMIVIVQREAKSNPTSDESYKYILKQTDILGSNFSNFGIEHIYIILSREI